MAENRNFGNEDSEGSPSGTLILGSITIAVLCLCVVIIPLAMGKVDLKDKEKQFVQEQMHQIVDQHYTKEVPVALKKIVMENGGYSPPALNKSAQAGPDHVLESEYKASKELNQARELRFHGKTDEAIRVMESYVVQHPAAVTARIELANCYLKSMQLRKARLACIAGLKAHPNANQKEALWQLLGRCPKG